MKLAEGGSKAPPILKSGCRIFGNTYSPVCENLISCTFFKLWLRNDFQDGSHLLKQCFQLG